MLPTLTNARKQLALAEAINSIKFYHTWQEGGSQKQDSRYGLKCHIPALLKTGTLDHTEFHLDPGMANKEYERLARELNSVIAPVIELWVNRLVLESNELANGKTLPTDED